MTKTFQYRRLAALPAQPLDLAVRLDALVHRRKDLKPETLREGEHFSVLPARKAQL
jgi:hypothetical protein